MWKIVVSSILCCMLYGEVDSPLEITPDWELKALGVRRDVHNVVDAIQEITTGVTAPHFGDAFLQTLKEAVQKQSTGEYIEYWPSGQLKARIGFKNSKAHGHFHGWYENGKDAFKGYYQEGVKQGIHIAFYPAGPRRYTEVGREIIYNERGELDGEQCTHYDNGELAVFIIYKNGKANGQLECWHSNQEEYVSVMYKDGKLRKDLTIPKRRPFGGLCDTYSTEIINKFEIEAEKEFGVKATASGGSMPHDVEVINVSFTKCARGTVPEARELIVKLKDKLVEIVNAHEKMRPYLREYPFASQRAEVSLAFEKLDGSRYTDGSVSFVCGGKGKLFYSAEDPNNRHKFIHLYEEPYETAVKIVKEKGLAKK